MSRILTVEPFGLARKTILPNSSGEVSCPVMTIDVAILCELGAGRSPNTPAENCAFCDLMASTTLLGVSLYAINLFGSTQIRMARSVPNNCATPTPGTRFNSLMTLRAR